METHTKEDPGWTKRGSCCNFLKKEKKNLQLPELSLPSDPDSNGKSADLGMGVQERPWNKGSRSPESKTDTLTHVWAFVQLPTFDPLYFHLSFQWIFEGNFSNFQFPSKTVSWPQETTSPLKMFNFGLLLKIPWEYRSLGHGYWEGKTYRAILGGQNVL